MDIQSKTNSDSRMNDLFIKVDIDDILTKKMSIKKETWKDVVGYEGKYKISSFGRCMNVKNNFILKERDNCKGYKYVSFNGNKHYLHRMVAESFINNPLNKKEVDHIDTIRDNNNVSNLKWVTRTENIRNPLTLLKNSKSHSNGVVQLDTNGNLIKIWDNQRLASEFLGVSRTSITSCVNGRLKTIKGFRFVRLKDYDNGKDYSITYKRRTFSNNKFILSERCISYLNDSRIIDVFSDTTEVCKKLKCKIGFIKDVCLKKKKGSRMFGNNYFLYFKDLPKDKYDISVKIFKDKYKIPI